MTIINKKGFVSVYLCMFFLTLVSVILLVTSTIRQSCIQTSAEALGHLWGQSVLAEYDLNLQRRYGLFGFYGYPALTKEKLSFYCSETYDASSGISPSDWKINTCSLYEYSLRNVEMFNKQIIAEGKVLSAKRTVSSKTPYKYVTEITAVNGHVIGEKKNLFQELPSEGSKNTFNLSSITNLLQGKTALKMIVKKGSNSFYQQIYIFSCFRNRMSEIQNTDSFFHQEIEYIICGKKTDKANEIGMKNRIVALREVLNLIYLNENEQTRTEALAIAELLTPGPAAVATQQSLLSMWALAESFNDYNLLIHGYQVPLMKTERSWATDLESVINHATEGYIYTGCDEGEFYEDYLKFFLHTVEEKIMLLRMMDLIQINMRNYYYDNFLFSEYNGGLNFSLQIDGKTHLVEMEYE